MKVAELIQQLQELDPNLDIVIEHRIKTGYDEGDIYHSIGIRPTAMRGKIVLRTEGYVAAGGW